MKADKDIQRDVQAELDWSPEVDATDIAVKVNGGEVTLTGFTDRYFGKYQAEVIARRVKGVAAIANDIEVKLLENVPTDPEIARAALAAIKLELPITWELVKPTVTHGQVCLEGTVEWQYQRQRAENAVRPLKGVLGVANSIQIRPNVAPENIKHRIEDAFRRLAQVDAGQISVDASGSEVTLRGEVRSWAERDQAVQTAWSAPGVSHVHNGLTVRT